MPLLSASWLPPPLTTIALCFLLSLVLLATVHFATGYLDRLSSSTSTNSDEKDISERERDSDQAPELSARGLVRLFSVLQWCSGDWNWSSALLPRWEGLPHLSLPVSLASDVVGSSVGNGMGVNRELVKYNWEMRRSRMFDNPPPALYQSQVPLSMAKIIMSRHTIRKPPSRPPRAPPRRPSVVPLPSSS